MANGKPIFWTLCSTIQRYWECCLRISEELANQMENAYFICINLTKQSQRAFGFLSIVHKPPNSTRLWCEKWGFLWIEFIETSMMVTVDVISSANKHVSSLTNVFMILCYVVSMHKSFRSKMKWLIVNLNSFKTSRTIIDSDYTKMMPLHSHRSSNEYRLLYYNNKIMLTVIITSSNGGNCSLLSWF